MAIFGYHPVSNGIGSTVGKVVARAEPGSHDQWPTRGPVTAVFAVDDDVGEHRMYVVGETQGNDGRHCPFHIAIGWIRTRQRGVSSGAPYS